MDDFSVELFKQNLDENIAEIPLFLLSETESTNLYARELVKKNKISSGIVIAVSQTGGRGTKGRSFFSPEGGAYLTFVLPADHFKSLCSITPAIAVAVARACAYISEKEISLKWVNDIIADDKKACGILCESIQMPDSNERVVLIGIGANIYEPRNGFPTQIIETASVISANDGKYYREIFMAKCIDLIYNYLPYAGENEIFRQYKERLKMIGKRIKVIKSQETFEATAVSLSEDYRLCIRYDDGREEMLSCDEVSIKNY